MATDFTHDVFLSHNSRDKPRVRQLADRLRASGLRVWFDEWTIRAGDDIYLAIERGLQTARVQVLCLSPAALGSEWVALERSTVLFRGPTNAGRRFIPLLLMTCDLPDTLRRYKYVDYRGETEAAFAELLAVCRSAEVPRGPAVSVARERRGRRRKGRDKAGSVLERTLVDDKLTWPRRIAVSPDGTWGSAGYQEGEVALWDLTSGSLRMKLSSGGTFSCVAVTGGDAGNFGSERIIVRDVATGRRCIASRFQGGRSVR
jgi:hypothetical protein